MVYAVESDITYTTFIINQEINKCYHLDLTHQTPRHNEQSVCVQKVSATNPYVCKGIVYVLFVKDHTMTDTVPYEVSGNIN